MVMDRVEVLRAACCLAATDGKIHVRELKLLRKLADEAGVGQASFQAMIDRSLREPSYFEKQFELMKADADSTMLALFGVAISDGQLDEEQRIILGYFADKLGLSSQRFDQLLAASEKLLRSRASESQPSTQQRQQQQ